MYQATQYVVWLITFSALLTTFLWFRGLYLYFKAVSLREALEVYVKSKYLMKSFSTALLTSVLILTFGIMSDNVIFIILGILWTVVFLYLFLRSGEWLKEAVTELEKMNILTERS